MTNVIKMSKSPQPTKLTDAQLQQLMRIEEILKNMGCEFRIRTPEGHGFANILVKNRGKGILSLNEKKGTAESEHIRAMRQHGIKRGDIKAYLDPILSDMKPGDVRIVPAGKFAFLKGTFVSSISSYMSNLFGPGQASTVWDQADQSYLVHMHGGI